MAAQAQGLCNHSNFIEYWLGDAQPWRCYTCREPIDEEDPRLLFEKQSLNDIKAADLRIQASDPEHFEDLAVRRGVRVDWLIRFTDTHACWDWPTHRVVAEIVKPATESNKRVRYCDLEDVKPFTGKADIFVSHCWGACWGTLVSAVAHESPPDRFVWLDCFAVRQWPGNSLDLDFTSVIERTNALLAVIHATDSIRRLNAQALDFGEQILPLKCRSQIGFCRIWCLAELGAARTAHKSIIFRAGNSVLYPLEAKQDSVEEEGKEKSPSDAITSEALRKFVSDPDVLDKLKYVVDCRMASASIEADRVRILNHIENSGGGYDGLNASIVQAIEGSSIVSCFGDTVLNPIENAECDANWDSLLNDQVLPPVVVNPAIMAACAGGKLKVVETLLSGRRQESDVWWRDDTGTTALWRACFVGLTEVVRTLLKYAVHDANSKEGKKEVEDKSSNKGDSSGGNGDDGDGAVEESNSSTSFIASMVNLAPFPDENSDRNGRATALSVAVTGGHIEIVKILLEHGANIDGKWTNDMLRDNTSVDQTVIEGSAANTTANSSSNNQGDETHTNTLWNTPLWLACLKNDVALVELLIQHGADLNLPARNTSTPLGIAVGKGYDKVVECLLKRGVIDVNSCDTTGKFPFLIASLQGSKQVCKLLLENGAIVDQTLPSGHSALYCAVCGNNIDFVHWLLEWCRQKEMVNSHQVVNTPANGRTPLWECALNGFDTMMSLLIDHGGDIYQPDEANGIAPITIASLQGHVGCLQVLLSQHQTYVSSSSNSNTATTSTTTATDEASGSDLCNQTYEEVRVTEAMDLNTIESPAGLRPLLAAISGGNVEVVSMLLEAGFDPSLPNVNNVTPLEEARENNQEEIVSLLLSHAMTQTLSV